jgi:hypothetical protein
MEDIDLFIKRLQEEQEIKDFLEKNIYPKSLKKHLANPYRIEKFPELEPTKVLDFEVENIENIDINIKNTFDKLNQFENQIKEMIQRENEEKNEHRENSCPICLEEFKPTSYFMPPCGHKICLHCFTRNMIKNQSTGGDCCLCREKILPKL